MKARVISGAAVWFVVIALAHLHFNVGWAELGGRLRRIVTGERGELIVGFLPVT